ncbi:presenilin-like protein [Capsicum annuum]|uniref:presenilin-like protein At1g08700 n=1 Tax=Capsicum annuum TaxID=4072 RepID=UPI001FB1842D|nr:presenilin-like protein At1g08700 [Capsicum annuum]
MDTTGSILESIGVEIIGVMSPVSICMFLVVLLISFLSSTTSPTTSSIRTAANLVYLETPSDSTTQKLEGALLNAAVFILLITLVTFLLVILYYYRFTNFLKYYIRFSALMVLGSMGGSILLSIIQIGNIPIDCVTFTVILLNFTVLGVLSVFSNGVPILVNQMYMVALGIIVAVWFTKLPEWTTWVLLVALALYDLVAVLAPGGPLKMLVELASSRDDELPALVYEARPNVGSRAGSRGQSLGVLLAGVSEGEAVELSVMSSSENVGSDGRGVSETRSGNVGRDGRGANETRSGNVGRDGRGLNETRRGNVGRDGRGLNETRSGNVGRDGRGMNETRSENEEIDGVREVEIEGETLPLMGGGDGRERAMANEEIRESNESDRGRVLERIIEGAEERERGIRLGLGDFVFYSVLVGRAAMYDMMTVYACYLAIISGLACTLILLAVCRHALPALPISIALGVIFYFLTRLLMEPFVVGTSTNLLMF